MAWRASEWGLSLILGLSIPSTMIRFLFFFFLSCLLSCQQPSTSSESNAAFEDTLKAGLDSLHALGQINGFGVTLVDEQGVLFSDGVGFADIEMEQAYTENTLQNIGSVSKTFIGISLMKAQEMGKLKLDDPVNNYLPFKVVNPSFPDVPITIRQLATHTSSILDSDAYETYSYVLKDSMDLTQLPEDVQNFRSPSAMMPMLVFLENMLSTGGEWYEEAVFSSNQPGATFDYTNTGATLAAAVLERATGQSFAAFTTEHILEPLGMDDSGWSFDAIELEAHSSLYVDPYTEIPFYALVTYPDGGLITSPADLGIYLAELIRGYQGEGKLLSKDSYAELFREQLDASHYTDRDEENPFDDEYNNGIFMGFTPSGYVGHTGGDPGIACFMFFNPETRRGRILMINTSIINREGVDQFYSIWGLLGEYESSFERTN